MGLCSLFLLPWALNFPALGPPSPLVSPILLSPWDGSSLLPISLIPSWAPFPVYPLDSYIPAPSTLAPEVFPALPPSLPSCTIY